MCSPSFGSAQRNSLTTISPSYRVRISGVSSDSPSSSQNSGTVCDCSTSSGVASQEIVTVSALRCSSTSNRKQSTSESINPPNVVAPTSVIERGSVKLVGSSVLAVTASMLHSIGKSIFESPARCNSHVTGWLISKEMRNITSSRGNRIRPFAILSSSFSKTYGF